MNFDTLVVHYTATYEEQDIGVKEIDAMHRARGWSGIGYHHLIRLDGAHEPGRSEAKIGAHVAGQNTGKLGLVTVGGLRRTSGPSIGVDTRTPEQLRTQIKLIEDKLREYPTIKRVVGHNELAATLCPAYKGSAWWDSVRFGGPKPPPMTSENTGLPIRSRKFLQRGSDSQEVVYLQGALAALGFFAVEPASTFGPATEAAVKEFQTSRGLVVDGKVGNATWAAILMEHNNV
jgi:N-acetylmuramoyl-L-alanine amidase